MVVMEMTEEDVGDVDGFDAGLQQAPMGSRPVVEEDHVAADADQIARRRPFQGWNRITRPQKLHPHLDRPFPLPIPATVAGAAGEY